MKLCAEWKWERFIFFILWKLEVSVKNPNVASHLGPQGCSGTPRSTSGINSSAASLHRSQAVHMFIIYFVYGTNIS